MKKSTWQHYAPSLRDYIHDNALGMSRPAGEGLPYPFLAPGSAQYDDVLWDWDSWLSNVALCQVLLEKDDPALTEELRDAERGSILNFLHYTGMDGYMPIVMGRNVSGDKPKDVLASNMHKPVIAQHAALLIRRDGGDAEWLREGFYPMQCFLNNYRNHRRHQPTGLYFWNDDNAVGVDNDPCTFGRPPKSSASIYLNCLMVREFEAAAYIADQLDQKAIGDHYRKDRDELVDALREHCWDEWLGFYYSVDINLNPGHLEPYPEEWNQHGWGKHFGQPCDWPCLIQRIGVWSGFLSLWAGVATKEQAERIVKHYRDDATFHCEAGVRTLSKQEKMFNVRASGNPSSWLGPVWIIANYMTWRGLVDYGFTEDARELAERTVCLLGRDLERFGAFHEYYLPDNGEPVLNRGFMNWNFLVLNMLAWLEERPVLREYGD